MVGKVAVAADVAGGESVSNMSVLRNWSARCCRGRCACQYRPRCPLGGGCRCCCCSYCYCRCHCGFGVTRVRFTVLNQKAGTADTESPDAATEFPCCLIPCDVFF